MDKYNFNAVNANIDQLISDLKKQYNLWVPSLGKELMFNGLTVKQQKKIIQCEVDRALGINSFLKEINDIVTENCTTKEEQFNTIDRLAIIVQLRSRSMNEIYTDKNKKTYKLPGSEEIKQYDVSDALSPYKFTIGEYDFNLRVPSLQLDNEGHQYIAKRFKDTQNLTNSQVVGAIITSELAKYIQSVTKGESTILDTSNVPFSKTVSFIENLPSYVTEEISKFSKKIRDIETQILTVKDSDGNSSLILFSSEFFVIDTDA